MPSPFPGMDPYLEGHLWVDVHNALASKIRHGILYPDVEVLRVMQSTGSGSAALEVPVATKGGSMLMPPAPLTLPMLLPVEVRIATVEIRDAAKNTLIACIEILSPVNKREPGLTPYRQKRQRLYNANVHLIEIDLLRRGTRPFNHPRLPETAYLVTVTRAQLGSVEVWPIHLQDSLPTIPVPLRSPDADVPLNLGEALTAIYEEAAYELSIDYHQAPPPPTLSEANI